MIKRITFHTAAGGLGHDQFVRAWTSAMHRWTAVPADRRPERVAVCEVLHDVAGTDRRFDAIELVWFADAAAAERAGAWDLVDGPARSVEVLVSQTVRMMAEEVVGRGADWLERRWAEGGERLKHMAVAHRAHGLTPEEFSERWRSRAGTVKRSGDGAVTRIPDEVRGLAYVQNHVAPGGGLGSSDVDAVNEVWFDDLDGLRRRVEWFAQQVDGEDDLVGDHFFLAARESVLLDAPGGAGGDMGDSDR